MPEDLTAPGREQAQPGPGTTRRGMLRGAAGLGTAGLAAALLAEHAATPAAATAAGTETPQQARAHAAPLVAYVRDARTGVVDVFTGTRHVQVTEPRLAALLSRAAVPAARQD